jgi:hypothetical protein
MEKELQMSIPNFKSHKDIYIFLQRSSDAWYRPMVEEYIEMCGSDIKSVDIKELNDWLKDELTSIENGYNEYLNTNPCDKITVL